jgi:hypothetical protein
VSGPKLAEALSFSHGKKTPKMDTTAVLLGWGCKAESRERYDPAKVAAAVEKGTLRIINYPEAITGARNKLALLTKLSEAGITVPGFISLKNQTAASLPEFVQGEIEAGHLTFPCVGFNEGHRGKPIFCWTAEDLEQVVKVNKSRKKGAIKIDYFRSLLQGTEWRIHVFRDSALSSEVKTLAKDPIRSTADSLMRKLTRRAEKNEIPITATTADLEYVVGELAADLTRGPSHLQRSTQHGWELQDVATGDVPAEVVAAAINALDAADLDLGAVSVVLEENTPVVTNVITAPSLSDAQLTAYADAISEFADETSRVAKKKKKKSVATGAEEGGPTASPELIARLSRKVRMGKISKDRAEEMMALLEE